MDTETREALSDQGGFRIKGFSIFYMNWHWLVSTDVMEEQFTCDFLPEVNQAYNFEFYPQVTVRLFNGDQINIVASIPGKLAGAQPKVNLSRGSKFLKRLGAKGEKEYNRRIFPAKEVGGFIYDHLDTLLAGAMISAWEDRVEIICRTGIFSMDLGWASDD